MLAKMWSNRNSFVAGGNAKWYSQFWKFLIKLNVLFPNDLAILLLGCYPNELKIYPHAKTCTRMFIAPLFIIAKLGSNQHALW